jgi:CheY-like chemotaxis protein
MVLHELATNAIKYGGLCDEGGRVDIRWSIEPSGDASERTSEANNGDRIAHLVIEWRETCPHAVTAPEETGFGSELIELLVTYDLSGEVERRFERDGLHCTMRVPTHALTGSVEPTFAPPAGMRPPAATTLDVHAAATDRSSTGAAAAANGAAPGSGYRVLLVEDSYTLARDLHRRLEAAGLDVVGPAPTLDKAFALIEAKPPHAAVLDVDLHGGKVYPLARHLTSIGVPYVLLTGYNVADLPEDLRAGAVIGKPVDVAALLKRVREFCEAGVPA